MVGYSRREIRQIVMDRDGGLCTICKRPATGVVPVNPNAGKVDWNARSALRASCQMTDCSPRR